MPPHSRCLLAFIFLVSQALAQTNSTSKRGISYIIGGHAADYNLLLSARSPLGWYYTWLPTTAPSDIFTGDQAETIEFVPTIHNNTKLDADLETLNQLPTSARRHLFTFNEPDGTFDTGGSDVSPEDAARAYVERLAPLRAQLGLELSHPATTGSARGFQWLRDFNAACWRLDPAAGCPADFVVAHWYGDFGGMAAWLGQLAAWYAGDGPEGDGDVGLGPRPLRVWVTELGVPGADSDTNQAVMAQTLPYLDQLAYVERYAWFGEFRPDGANNWTGPGLAMFENDGGLSDLGALYLGGEANGFAVGDKGLDNDSDSSAGGSSNSNGTSGEGDGTNGANATGGDDTGSNGEGGTDSGSGAGTAAGTAFELLWLTVIVVMSILI